MHLVDNNPEVEKSGLRFFQDYCQLEPREFLIEVQINSLAHSNALDR
jgi:hypothetical protein